MRSGLATRPTIEGPRGSSARCGQRDAGHQRQVCGLVAALAEIDAGRRLRRAGDAEEDDVGLLESSAAGRRHAPCEVQRIDARGNIGVEHVLAGHDGVCAARRDRIRTRSMIGSSTCRHGTLSSRQRRSMRLDQLLLDDRIEDDAGRLPPSPSAPCSSCLRAHERMHVLDRPHLRVLHRRRALADGGQRLAGRIRDQMQVEVAWQAVGHAVERPCSYGLPSRRRLVGQLPLVNKNAHRQTRRDQRSRQWLSLRRQGIMQSRLACQQVMPRSTPAHTASAH